MIKLVGQKEIQLFRKKFPNRPQMSIFLVEIYSSCSGQGWHVSRRWNIEFCCVFIISIRKFSYEYMFYNIPFNKNRLQYLILDFRIKALDFRICVVTRVSETDIDL